MKCRPTAKTETCLTLQGLSGGAATARSPDQDRRDAAPRSGSEANRHGESPRRRTRSRKRDGPFRTACWPPSSLARAGGQDDDHLRVHYGEPRRPCPAPASQANRMPPAASGRCEKRRSDHGSTSKCSSLPLMRKTRLKASRIPEVFNGSWSTTRNLPTKMMLSRTVFNGINKPAEKFISATVVLCL
jgi:hypothetical protein